MKIHLDTETKTIYVYQAKLVELLDLIHSIDSEHREEWVVKDSTLRITPSITPSVVGYYPFKPPYGTDNTNESGIYDARIFAGSANGTNITDGYPTGSSIAYTGSKNLL